MSRDLGIFEEIRRAKAAQTVGEMAREANAMIKQIREARENVARVAKESEWLYTCPEISEFETWDEAIRAMQQARIARDNLIRRHQWLISRINSARGAGRVN